MNRKSILHSFLKDKPFSLSLGLHILACWYSENLKNSFVLLEKEHIPICLNRT